MPEQLIRSLWISMLELHFYCVVSLRDFFFKLCVCISCISLPLRPNLTAANASKHETEIIPSVWWVLLSRTSAATKDTHSGVVAHRLGSFLDGCIFVVALPFPWLLSQILSPHDSREKEGRESLHWVVIFFPSFHIVSGRIVGTLLVLLLLLLLFWLACGVGWLVEVEWNGWWGSFLPPAVGQPVAHSFVVNWMGRWGRSQSPLSHARWGWFCANDTEKWASSYLSSHHHHTCR